MRTNIYIDGFNLYYGVLKGTPYKWLDLDAFCRKLLPKNDIRAIKYFTARVKAQPWDEDLPNRQQTYLRALATIPHVEVFYGYFLSNETRMARADGNGLVDVIKTEEKGSDVSLGAHVVWDACSDRIDAAVLVTNDSDLAEPMRIVRKELGISVGLIAPIGAYRRVNRQLRENATFMRNLRDSTLRDCQFPDPVVDAQGKNIRKPSAW